MVQEQERGDKKVDTGDSVVECKSCAEVILKEYFKQRDLDGDGVIVDWDAVIHDVLQNNLTVEQAILKHAEYLPGSWLCRYFTMKYIVQEMDKGRKLGDIIEEIRTKEPLRYRGCIKQEGVIYEVEETLEESGKDETR